MAYLEEMGDVVENGPGLHVVSVHSDLVVVDPVEEEGQGLEEHQGGHHPVDPGTQKNSIQFKKT